MTKRLFDIPVSLVALVVLAPIILLVFLAVRIDSAGPALFWSQRYGRDGRLFNMPKFRTMRVGTPQVATHLLRDPRAQLTRIGGFLRRTSLDELPQLWSVLAGDMSLVGPRPALFNQDDLMKMRRECGVHALRPGVTGWAQVNGRDELDLAEKVAFDSEYLQRYNLIFDVKILLMTVYRVVARKGVTH